MMVERRKYPKSCT